MGDFTTNVRTPSSDFASGDIQPQVSPFLMRRAWSESKTITTGSTLCGPFDFRPAAGALVEFNAVSTSVVSVFASLTTVTTDAKQVYDSNGTALTLTTEVLSEVPAAAYASHYLWLETSDVASSWTATMHYKG